ncbi:amidohydrolase family protein [Candidatus Peribacteria bacterium]|nr:amidohydrolase family protein [Candidatus Peribacteria bacterium]
MEQNCEIIDVQVNYGDTPYGPNSDFELYRNNAERIGIARAVIYPTPTHIHQQNSIIETSCYWRPGNMGNSRYYLTLKNQETGNVTTVEQPKNPFRNFNIAVLEFVRNFNATRNAIRLHFTPKIHPILDDKSALEELIGDETVMLKIHGLATHTNPDDIPTWVVEMLIHYDLPLVAHTDYIDLDTAKRRSAMEQELNELCAQNSPLAHIHWALKNNVRMIINHGARLDPEAINIINNEEKLIMAHGPDSHLEARQDHLVTKTDDYVETLFRMADPDSVMFSTDYRWNVGIACNWDAMRWDSIERLRKVLSPDDANKVLSENAFKFLRIPKS